VALVSHTMTHVSTSFAPRCFAATLTGIGRLGALLATLKSPLVSSVTQHPPMVGDSPTGRSLSLPAFAGIVVVYLLILQGLAMVLAEDGMEYGKFPDVETVIRGLWIPVGVSVVFVVGVVSYLGWWQEVLHERKPVQRSMWFVPIFMIAVIVIGMNYPELADRGLGFTLAFLLGALFVGFAEETMFRGISISVLRRHGLTEGKVALWAAVIFGLAHGTNIFTEGTGALAQVLVTGVAGYFFYITRRVSGGIALCVVLHGLWDFSLLGGSIGEEMYPGAALFVIANVILAGFLIARRHHIEPASPATAAA
jgi:uncharacterized protein